MSKPKTQVIVISKFMIFVLGSVLVYVILIFMLDITGKSMFLPVCSPCGLLASLVRGMSPQSMSIGTEGVVCVFFT